jgi:hypothetical protein
MTHLLSGVAGPLEARYVAPIGFVKYGAIVGGHELDDGVGIDDRGRIVRGDDENVVGQAHDVEHVIGDAGRRVEEQEVEISAGFLEGRDQPRPLLIVERRERPHAAAGRDDADARRSRQRDLADAAVAGEHRTEVLFRRQAEHDVDVAEAEVGVENADAVSEPGHRHGEIDGEAGLAHAALAARHGNAGRWRPRSGGCRQ